MPATGSMLVVITADKGMCGAFNTNIIRQATRFLDEHEAREVELGLVGRKGRDHFRRRSYRVRSENVGIFQALEFPVAQKLARQRSSRSTRAARSTRSTSSTTSSRASSSNASWWSSCCRSSRSSSATEESALDYLYEPEPARIFEHLVPKHVEIQVWRALLESAAAEHGARMAAMDSATKNAGEMIDDLTLYMNKVRQAAITREIIEVVSGAGA